MATGLYFTLALPIACAVWLIGQIGREIGSGRSCGNLTVVSILGWVCTWGFWGCDSFTHAVGPGWFCWGFQRQLMLCVAPQHPSTHAQPAPPPHSEAPLTWDSVHLATCDSHLTNTIVSARIVVVEWRGHMTSHLVTASLNNQDFSPNCGHKSRKDDLYWHH